MNSQISLQGDSMGPNILYEYFSLFYTDLFYDFLSSQNPHRIIAVYDFKLYNHRNNIFFNLANKKNYHGLYLENYIIGLA